MDGTGRRKQGASEPGNVTKLMLHCGAMAFLKYTKREEMQQSYEQVHWPYFDFIRRVT